MVKSCLNCKFAEWSRTASGRLHPSGDGKCEFPLKMPKLPASMVWLEVPRVSFGLISRKKDLKEDCVYFQRRHLDGK
jgi:hypothetical protein